MNVWNPNTKVLSRGSPLRALLSAWNESFYSNLAIRTTETRGQLREWDCDEPGVKVTKGNVGGTTTRGLSFARCDYYFRLLYSSTDFIIRVLSFIFWILFTDWSHNGWTHGVSVLPIELQMSSGRSRYLCSFSTFRRTLNFLKERITPCYRFKA